MKCKRHIKEGDNMTKEQCIDEIKEMWKKGLLTYNEAQTQVEMIKEIWNYSKKEKTI